MKLTTYLIIIPLLSSFSHATVIFQDSFSRTGLIAESTPDIGVDWNASVAPWTADGSVLQVSNSSTITADVASFALNTTYRLSLDLSVTTTNSGWIGFGFEANGISKGFLYQRGANTAVVGGNYGLQYFSPGAGGGVLSDLIFPKNLAIQVETGATLASSVIRFYEGNNEIGSGVILDANNISNIMITTSGGLGSIDDIIFESNAVPEPSSSLLIGLGSMAFLLRRKRNNLVSNS